MSGSLARGRRLLLLGLAAVLGAAVTVWAFDASERERGLAIFLGQAPLEAKVLGHADPLPPDASRCANCHAGAAPLGERLDAARLLMPTARRGGPPSRYDESTFCRVLRDGIDPAWVQLPREMPRYALSDADCRALWRHVTHA